MPKESAVEPVFDTIAASSLLGLKASTLEVWRCKGIGPRFVKLGARVVYRLCDINEFLENRTRTSTADPGRPAAE